MRYILLDKVTELVIGDYAKGIKNIAMSEDVLADHFPDYPVMPGALLLESASQLAGFLLEMTFNKPGQVIKRSLLAQIQKAKFYEMTGPGDQLELTATIESMLDSSAQVRVDFNLGEKRVVTSVLTFVMKPTKVDGIHSQRRSLFRIWTRDLKEEIEIL